MRIGPGRPQRTQCSSATFDRSPAVLNNPQTMAKTSSNGSRLPRRIAHPAIEALKTRFPAAGLSVGELRDMVTVVVPRERIFEVCTFLRDDPGQRYDLLVELNGVDYLNYPGGAPARFAVNYGLTSVPLNQRLWLKVLLNPERSTRPREGEFRDADALENGDPGLVVDSVTPLWAGAEWMEREVYDMFGIVFRGHPDLRRILTWNGFGARPLRKDYPLRGVGEREDYPIVSRETA